MVVGSDLITVDDSQETVVPLDNPPPPPPPQLRPSRPTTSSLHCDEDAAMDTTDSPNVNPDLNTYASAAKRGASKYPYMAILVKDDSVKYLDRQEFAEIWLGFRDRVCQYVEMGLGQPLRSDGRSWKDGKGYIACEDLFTLSLIHI